VKQLGTRLVILNVIGTACESELLLDLQFLTDSVTTCTCAFQSDLRLRARYHRLVILGGSIASDGLPLIRLRFDHGWNSAEPTTPALSQVQPLRFGASCRVFKTHCEVTQLGIAAILPNPP
jgi:hypothetical protein